MTSIKKVSGLVVLCVALVACVAYGQSPSGKTVIAHRGGSGYLPEHTLAAYALAHTQGADYIEPDLVLTKDGHFICMHDITLQSSTNVEQVFPDKRRDDGKWYAADLTLAEVKRLRVHERLKTRFPQQHLLFEVPTFEEMIQLIQGLNKTTGREAGIYPELKQPTWHAENGLPMEKAVLKLLTKYGYTKKDSKIFIQCFWPETLIKLRKELGSPLPLIQLVSDDKRQAELRTEKGMDFIATYANGIGPDKKLIAQNPALVRWAHARKLEVHPYTLRADDVGAPHKSIEAELKFYYFTLGVDSLFTDHPDKAVHILATEGKTAR